ncbi:CopG antitoxin of type II toxin-antitoxin system [uncultured archaeon]|nr:CopG antitoxin of type II toxin-antitoxin system [uncultured archaeon]
MKKIKTSISKSQSYEEIGEYWDKHDLAEHWEETKPVEFEVDIQSEITYFAVDTKLSEKIQSLARQRGISPDTLLNMWVQEKLQEQNA